MLREIALYIRAASEDEEAGWFIFSPRFLYATVSLPLISAVHTLCTSHYLIVPITLRNRAYTRSLSVTPNENVPKTIYGGHFIGHEEASTLTRWLFKRIVQSWKSLSACLFILGSAFWDEKQAISQSIVGKTLLEVSFVYVSVATFLQ